MQKTKRVITLEFVNDEAADAFVDFLNDDGETDGEEPTMQVVSVENPDLTNVS